ncbi:hypothetical protein LINGRAHAP2_LOCUS15248 [Linum grandiflorum]
MNVGFPGGARWRKIEGGDSPAVSSWKSCSEAIITFRLQQSAAPISILLLLRRPPATDDQRSTTGDRRPAKTTGGLVSYSSVTSDWIGNRRKQRFNLAVVALDYHWRFE